ncbi:hypothetical protein H9P43_009456 [Blastocladiella emersonii ATCC 22665]|nr:hypothetical protein H9P43_009456 [Blastocladiella emersonii ATCC 22665]
MPAIGARAVSYFTRNAKLGAKQHDAKPSAAKPVSGRPAKPLDSGNVLTSESTVVCDPASRSSVALVKQITPKSLYPWSVPTLGRGDAMLMLSADKWLLLDPLTARASLHALVNMDVLADPLKGKKGDRIRLMAKLGRLLKRGTRGNVVADEEAKYLRSISYPIEWIDPLAHVLAQSLTDLPPPVVPTAAQLDWTQSLFKRAYSSTDTSAAASGELESRFPNLLVNLQSAPFHAATWVLFLESLARINLLKSVPSAELRELAALTDVLGSPDEHWTLLAAIIATLPLAKRITAVLALHVAAVLLVRGLAISTIVNCLVLKLFRTRKRKGATVLVLAKLARWMVETARAAFGVNGESMCPSRDASIERAISCLLETENPGLAAAVPDEETQPCPFLAVPDVAARAPLPAVADPAREEVSLAAFLAELPAPAAALPNPSHASSSTDHLHLRRPGLAVPYGGSSSGGMVDPTQLGARSAHALAQLSSSSLAASRARLLAGGGESGSGSMTLASSSSTTRSDGARSSSMALATGRSGSAGDVAREHWSRSQTAPTHLLRQLAIVNASRRVGVRSRAAEMEEAEDE